jgi:hypothetical protein
MERLLNQKSDNYYDLRKADDDDDEGAWEYEPWANRPWFIVPKSGRRKLTTLHQDVINQVIAAFWQPEHPIHKKGTG